MSIIDAFAFLGGLSAKLYDDIEDNEEFEEFGELKKNIFLTEFLKGLHYVSFMAVGLSDNLFYLVSYVGNVLHSFKNKEGYSNPYENSLFYSFFAGLFLLNYVEMYKTIVSINIYELFGILFFVGCFVVEPFIIKSEISLFKLCIRFFLTLISIILYFVCSCQTNKFIYLYACGYLLCSFVVQYICVNKKMHSVGFEPTSFVQTADLKSAPLDHSGKNA